MAAERAMQRLRWWTQGKQRLDSKSSDHAEQQSDNGLIYVEFEEDDPEDPMQWSRKRKWTVTALGCWFTCIVGWVGATLPVGIPDMEQDLHNLRELSYLATSLFPFGCGVIPLFTAPLSEVWGRNKLYLVAFFLFNVVQIGVGTAQNNETVIVCRFLAGAFGSTGATLVSGSIADIWITEERGSPMALFTAASFAGIGIGPAIMGYVAYTIGWRWIQYIQAMLGGTTFILYLLFMRETRGSVILAKRARMLRQKTGDQRYQCKAEAEREPLGILLRRSLIRPLKLLVTEPVVIAMSLWVGFSFAVLWALLISVTIIFENVYGFNRGEAGLVFWTIFIGVLIGSVLNIFQERIYKQKFSTNGPEARLYMSCLGGLLLPTGGLILSFAQGRGHWSGPAIGVVIIMTGIFTIFIAGVNFLADSYLTYASSAIAALSFVRYTMGASFPLFTNQMYSALTYTWASFLISMVGLLLAIIPFILLAYGPKIRARSKVLQEVHASAAT